MLESLGLVGSMEKIEIPGSRFAVLADEDSEKECEEEQEERPAFAPEQVP